MTAKKTAAAPEGRRRRTPRERAEEALGVSERKVDKLTTARDKLKAELSRVEEDLQAETRTRDYLRKNPALPLSQTGNAGGDKAGQGVPG